MNMKFYRKLPIPMEVKEMLPITDELAAVRKARTEEIKSVLDGRDKRLLCIIGPCSADREDAVMEYLYKLKKIAEQVEDKLLIVPRIYTGKPRTTGEGYLGMLHQPDPTKEPDLLAGIVAIRKIHIRALSELGFGSADEMLYPENHRYVSDLLAYTTVGARSVEDQQHRLTASGLDIPVGMKNPTGGDISVMLNAIKAAQAPHVFCYRGWEVGSEGNPYAHAILRGYSDTGGMHKNCDEGSLLSLAESYAEYNLKNPAVIVDTNHANSGKNCLLQPEIVNDVMKIYASHPEISRILRGFMIESYIEDGAQSIGEGEVFGRSITDPCLGIEKTEKLLYKLADII